MGLVEIEKRFVKKKPQTLARLSDSGRRTIEGYWKEIEEIRESAAHWQPDLVLAPSYS